jgi:hypothetical protein
MSLFDSVFEIKEDAITYCYTIVSFLGWGGGGGYRGTFFPAHNLKQSVRVVYIGCYPLLRDLIARTLKGEKGDPRTVNKSYFLHPPPTPPPTGSQKSIVSNQ